MKSASSKVATEMLFTRITDIQNGLQNLYNKDSVFPDWLKIEEVNIFKKYNAEELYRAIDGIISEQDWLCPIRKNNNDENESYYSISKDEIVMPNRNDYMNEECFIEDVLHNMVHSTGAQGRLNRISSGMSSKDFLREELIAELTATYICACFGISKYVKDCALSYLQDWKTDIQEDEDYVDNVLSASIQATKIINDFLQSHISTTFKKHYIYYDTADN